MSNYNKNMILHRGHEQIKSVFKSLFIYKKGQEDIFQFLIFVANWQQNVLRKFIFWKIEEKQTLEKNLAYDFFFFVKWTLVNFELLYNVSII